MKENLKLITVNKILSTKNIEFKSYLSKYNNKFKLFNIKPKFHLYYNFNTYNWEYIDINLNTYSIKEIVVSKLIKNHSLLDLQFLNIVINNKPSL